MQFPENIQTEIFRKKDFLPLLTNQIEREFLFFNLDIHLPKENLSLENILIRLVNVLQSNTFKNTEKLFHLLYSIDISEVEIKKYLSANEFDFIERSIAELIVLRCAKKVYFKNKYSTK